MRGSRRRRHTRLVPAALLLALGATGCAGANQPDTAPSPSGAPESAPTDSPSPTSPAPPLDGDTGSSDDASGHGPGDDHGHDPLPVPATTAGDLSQRSFPRPADLGPEWSYVVDEGDAEEGYVGNGTPALARDVTEVLQTVVPFGCPVPRDLPTPTAALEVDYAAAGTKVITIRATFTDRAAARAFFDIRRRSLERCAGRDAGAGIGRLVVTVESAGPAAVVSDRTPDSDPWTELALTDGDELVLVAAQTRPGLAPMTPAQTRRLVSAFRG